MKDIIEYIDAHLDRPIVMVGLMGAGKTRIGFEIAQKLGWQFIDADVEIENAAGCTVSEIFERYGEENFRDGERRVIKRIVEENKKCVLATGGGAVMNAETAELIKNHTVAIWLNTDIDVLVERTSRNDKRPLLRSGDPYKILSDLYEKRSPVYDDVSCLEIKGQEKSIAKLVKKILQAIQDKINA